MTSKTLIRGAAALTLLAASLAAHATSFGSKLIINGETLIVGADLYLATPIWMKVENTASWPPSLPA